MGEVEMKAASLENFCYRSFGETFINYHYDPKKDEMWMKEIYTRTHPLNLHHSR